MTTLLCPSASPLYVLPLPSSQWQAVAETWLPRHSITVYCLAVLVPSPATTVPALLRALDAENGDNAQRALRGYLQTQWCALQAADAPRGDTAVCLACRVDQGGRTSPSDRPASCLIARLRQVAIGIGVETSVQVVPMWSRSFSADESDLVQATTHAEAIAGLLQLTQGSFAGKSPGYGGHRQLGERQGARSRHI